MCTKSPYGERRLESDPNIAGLASGMDSYLHVSEILRGVVRPCLSLLGKVEDILDLTVPRSK